MPFENIKAVRKTKQDQTTNSNTPKRSKLAHNQSESNLSSRKMSIPENSILVVEKLEP